VSDPLPLTRLSPFSRGRIHSLILLGLLSPLQRGTAAVGGRGSLTPYFLCKSPSDPDFHPSELDFQCTMGLMTKKFIWIGMFVGSTIGNLVPMLWGGDALSISGLFFSLVGGVAGIWVGYRWGQSM
jgi:hypothetical protein